VVGDRAFGAEPDQVARLGRAVCEGMMAGGILPVIKHMPGHGRAHADSHLAMPRVDTALDELARTDFRPFRLLNDMPLGITAHVSYEAIDRGTPGTLSRAVIRRLIRGQIGFDGLLMTDDLSMAALSGSPAERARKAIAAGCDVVLHCNGQLDEMAEVAGALSAMTPEASRRFARASAAPKRDDAIDIDNLLSEFDNLLDARAGS
jgi:beta-N-acetylhexosaminidase